MRFIKIRGASQHNLKHLNVDIPCNKLVVVTGISGSGKSTLAFDTLCAEGQRRYVESLSVHTRQFLERRQKPQVELIEGLSPAIAIDQKAVSHNPRSTVGTITETYDFLRLLYARIGLAYCPACDQPVTAQSIDQMIERLLSYPENTRLLVLAPLAHHGQERLDLLLNRLKREGYSRLRVNGQIGDIDAIRTLHKQEVHTLEVVVDRFAVKPGIRNRMSDSLELALALSAGSVLIATAQEGTAGDHSPVLFSEKAVCPKCSFCIPEFNPASFSFNLPLGACPECAGSGIQAHVDPERLIHDASLSLPEGALTVWTHRRSPRLIEFLRAFAQRYGADIRTPFAGLPEEFKTALFYGSGEDGDVPESDLGGPIAFEGLIPLLQRRLQKAEAEHSAAVLHKFMAFKPCPACQGARLRPEARSVKINTLSIHHITAMPVREALLFLKSISIEGQRAPIAERVLREITLRLEFLQDVGLGYISLDRSAHSLSSGELQRIRLATQMGAGLTGVLYVLDEPSIGLHPKDHRMLMHTLTRMRDMGNTILVVEHDRQTIMSADHVIELGPGAGVQGGCIVFSGPPEALLSSDSLTGQYISGRLAIAGPAKRRAGTGRIIRLSGATHHNLKNLQVDFRLGCLTCVTGVSGSGKSSLVIDTLYGALTQRLSRRTMRSGRYNTISGLEYVDAVISIDQFPLGRTPRSNAATYIGLFAFIRELYAKTPDARVRGYTSARFSFNARGGRCEACRGDGVVKVEMHFLPDFYVTCETCRGKRYNRETLEVRFKGCSIADVLAMTVDEALRLFAHMRVIRERLQTLADVGLGYLQLGQAGTTLSGGEAQRIKLARELSKRVGGRTVYILDEPTTGLHLHDIHQLMRVLNRLVDAGNTVIMIEHHLDVIKAADQVIDLGPEGGEGGGYVIGVGTPEQIAANENSDTGKFLLAALA